MGTRNLTKVIDKEGTIKVAQYGQWDGYPAGQGLTALHHARMAHAILNGLNRVRFIGQPEAQHLYSGFDFENGNFSLMYPSLSRDTGADILGLVAYGAGEILLIDESEFENDDLFCEGVYTIDFQTNSFISKYGDSHVLFSLDALPTNEEYLSAFEA